MPSIKIKYLFVILLCVATRLNAQTIHVLTNNAILQVDAYDVLRDNHYSFNQVLTDTTLRFTQKNLLNTSATDYYWLKTVIENPYPNNESYRFSLSLPLNYTLFFQDSNGKWISRNAGLAVPEKQRERGVIPCVLRGQTKNVLYVKIDVRDLQRYGYTIKPAVIMEKEISFDGRENILWYSWLIGVMVLAGFACYNLYIYFQLKDPIYAYYLIIQAGAIIFVTAFKHFLNLFFPFGVYNIRLNPNGVIYTYDLNAFFLHIGSMIIISGVLQLTRLYLRTSELLPRWDRLLKSLLWGFIIFDLASSVITITRVYYLDSYTLLYYNLFILLILLTIIFTCIIADKYRVRAAKHFLLANTLPLTLMAVIAVYFVIHSAPSYLDNHSFLPEMAIFSQVFTFAVALVARMRVVNEELKAKEQEVRKLEADIAQAAYQSGLIEKENEMIILTIQLEKDKNELLQQRLEANQRELVGNSLYIHQKNKLLADLKDQLQDIDHLYPHVKHPGLKNIKSSLKDGQHLDAEWDKFKLHFEQVHPDFFEKLQTNHPSLTRYELRLYAYFHIHLSTKEIAALLNIEPASVRQAKARLNKKMSNPAGAVSSSPEQD